MAISRNPGTLNLYFRVIGGLTASFSSVFCQPCRIGAWWRWAGPLQVIQQPAPSGDLTNWAPEVQGTQRDSGKRQWQRSSASVSLLRLRGELCFVKCKCKDGLNTGSFCVHSVLPSVWILVSFSLRWGPWGPRQTSFLHPLSVGVVITFHPMPALSRVAQWYWCGWGERELPCVSRALAIPDCWPCPWWYPILGKN